eukprot:8219768-Pyramimonas_sp.AAC.1
MTYGLPLEPLQPGRPEVRPPVHEWGDCRSEAWGPLSYVDASGRHGNHPTLARVGWSVVQLCPASGWPLRARYGGLPGADQMVPRGERYAGLQA